MLYISKEKEFDSSVILSMYTSRDNNVFIIIYLVKRAICHYNITTAKTAVTTVTIIII
jgi:hypothetical protein